MFYYNRMVYLQLFCVFIATVYNEYIFQYFPPKTAFYYNKTSDIWGHRFNTGYLHSDLNNDTKFLAKSLEFTHEASTCQIGSWCTLADPHMVQQQQQLGTCHR